jgi:Flp pilus assembly secretin CpaC
MIQQSSRQVIDGFPGLKSLPILGALFRSRDTSGRRPSS